ncbi:MAG: preprotein translocase subunit SecG [Planctomycetota bacterium]|jgi:protein translocase SecG subunit
MELNDKTIKWTLAIVAIFGIIFTMYFMKMVIALKMLLVLTCITLIGAILLQAGKGGGLAAIGGLQDQSSLGTRTSTFLGKTTYLIGAVFIICTICLTKVSSVTFVKEIAPEQATEMPAGHPPAGGMPPGQAPMGEMPPGHPPAGGMLPGQPPMGGMQPYPSTGELPPGHPPAGGMQPYPSTGELPPGHPPAGRLAPPAPPVQQGPPSAALGWQEKQEQKKSEKQETEEKQQEKSSDQ